MHTAISFVPPLAQGEAAPALGSVLRVALIGAGAMGRRHARVLASRPGQFALVGITDVNAAAAAELAEEHHAQVIAREGEAIAAADAVIVATPIGAHAGSVRRALAARRHVLVEKPIAASSAQSAQLIALAQASGVRLFVGHSERFNPVVRALARLVDPASVKSIELRRIGTRQARTVNEGALVNLGVHDLDLAAYLTRAPLSPTATVGELDDAGIEERAHVVALTDSGATVHVVVDQRPPGGERRRSIAVRTLTHVWNGDLLVPSLVRTCRETGARESIPLDTEEPLAAQALAFLAAVRGAGASEIATGRDGMRALLAAERARQAILVACRTGENLA